ncbi:hypothetical protein BCR32DRAFT_291238 [Anaeromyces robustus]|uniref:Uncharacterized protein n=1 Tax=Anaeromyces robustus TaxID=1754192 RepID=A0A1Y1XFS9_9FUNG|nr:hypothetical protein BCR32DRAFT_291238 [Anaeromyces robustus]|eukprot:ORX84605.1 hypothetical protein BCR32DRAFT_291238 [Anaeromyces robustus]
MKTCIGSDEKIDYSSNLVAGYLRNFPQYNRKFIQLYKKLFHRYCSNFINLLMLLSRFLVVASFIGVNAFKCSWLDDVYTKVSAGHYIDTPCGGWFKAGTVTCSGRCNIESIDNGINKRIHNVQEDTITVCCKCVKKD